MEDALSGQTGDKTRENPLKMADRAHVNLPNKKPPWWSTAEYGVPMNYGQKAARPTPGGRKLLTADELSAGNTETAIVKSAPGIVDLAKKAKKEQLMLEEERRIEPTRIEELEKLLRNEVARHTPYHERKHTILVRAFATFDHENKGTLPLDAFRRALQCFNVELTPAEARAIFRKFGQDGQRRLPYVVFARALFTTKSRMLAWTNTHHMNTRAKNGLPKGAPFIASANKEQKAVDRLFDAKIQPFNAGPGHCVTACYPPTTWAMDVWETKGKVHPVVRARHPPDVEIDLDHVYGYNGVSVYTIVAGRQQIDPISSVVSPNLFYTSTRGIVYSTAALGVILEWEEDSGGALASVNQRFFQAHTEEVLCLKCDESRNYCATGQRPIKKTGPGDPVDPFVSIWDMNSMQELMQLPHNPEKPEKPTDPVDPVGGIQAVCFSEDGQLVISCARNMASTVFVWLWRQQTLLWRYDTKASVPPAIYGCKWNRVEKADGSRHFDFATFGMKHINFFKEDPKAPNPKGHLRNWIGEAGSFVNKQDAGGGKPDPKTTPQVQDVMCVEFLSNGNIVTGMASGDIYLWKPMATSHGMQCDKILMIPGADPTKPKVKAHLHTVQVLKIRYVKSSSGDAVPTLLSGGGGGKIKIWKDLDGEVPIYAHEIELPKKQGERAVVPPQVPIGFNGTGQPPSVKALDCFPGADDLVVGTDKCDIYKIKLVAKPDGTYEPAVPTLLVKGHTADVNAIDVMVHPTREYLFASAAMSDMVYLWDANLKSLVGQCSLKGRRGTCITFRGDAKHLAIGTDDGCIYVFRELNDWEGDSLRLQKVPEMGIWPLRDCTQAIQCVVYSPDLRTFAVGSHDQMVDLYDCASGNYTRLKRCQGHSATVSHMDFSLDSRILQSQCNAYEILYWNTDRGEPAADPAQKFSDARRRRKFGLQITEEQRDTKWATWTVKFGFDVMGIWPSGYINTSIKMVARSPDPDPPTDNPQQLLATVDDKGNLMVLNYPAVVYRQPMHSHPGHSSFVMNVKWLRYKDDNGEDQLMLITAGGHDRSLMTWRVKKLLPPTIDDPKLLGNEGQLMEAKKEWYYKYTASEWSGEQGIYTKYEKIYKGEVGPKDPAVIAKAEKKALEGGADPAASKPKPDLSSASAAELKTTISAQEQELAKQKKLIEDLQKQLAAK